MDRSVCDGIAQPVAPSFFIGSGLYGSSSIEATIDELRISDSPRIGHDQGCGRILVADSSLDRIQAFGPGGDYVTVYNGSGGVEQLSSPQGLTVDGGGRVIVADQGNDRLVILGFDGTDFGYLDSLNAGLDGPTGLALDTRGNIAVADTGNNRVVVLDPTGTVLADYSEPDDAYTGLFNSPLDVAVDPCGSLVVADTYNNRVVTVQRGWPNCKCWLPLILRMWEAE
jgi:DNA-binding beta-propeller fold protein YncE